MRTGSSRRRFLPLIALLLAVPAAADPVANAPTLNQTLDSFAPTPKQTIALRDFLGGRGDKIVPLGIQPNGLAYFDLRDAKNQRTGQIAVGHDEAEGSIFIARLTGPAVYDPTRRATAPRAVNAKMRGAISALLAGAEAGSRYEAYTAKSKDMFVRDRVMLALLPQPVSFPDRIVETEASFFSDGSGFLRVIRAPVGTANPALAAIRVSAKFFPAIDGDGKKAFRDAVIGIDADFTASLSDFGNKLPCPTTGCLLGPPVTLLGELHLTRWPHAVVPSAPANLIAQISPPPPALPDVLQDGQTPAPQPQAGAIDATGEPPHTN